MLRMSDCSVVRAVEESFVVVESDGVLFPVVDEDFWCEDEIAFFLVEEFCLEFDDEDFFIDKDQWLGPEWKQLWK